MNTDLLMQRCLDLAYLGFGKVSPNPMVGSLIYRNGEILSEGFHEKYGNNHAELNAIQNANKAELEGSTLFVNLEPCSHYGKTPPCADLIIENRIKSVYIACTDTNPLVAGKGIEKMIRNGIRVYLGVKEKAARNLNKRFFTFHEKRRPYIILKWAESADGFIGREAEKIWISGDYSSRFTHKQRASEDAILVGTNTYRLDKPKLTTRNWIGKDPLRLVIDLKMQNTYQKDYLKHGFIITQESTALPSIKIEKAANLISELCKKLYEMSVQSLIVEGGANTIQNFIDQNMWDEAFVIKSKNKKLEHGVKANLITDNIIRQKNMIEDDVLLINNLSA